MLTDVITAVATPPGRSAIALVRLSGAEAFDVAARVLEPFDRTAERRAKRAHVVHPPTNEILDDVLYVVYHAPASYTGEDVVEISTHGGLLAPAETLGALVAAGARVAAPGEFTRRAVLNGKMDLLQAEAVGDLIDATAPAQRRAALDQLDRGLSRRIEHFRSDVLELEALVSYEIDFPEEDGGPVAPERIEAAIDALTTALAALSQTAAEGERLREGAVAVIAGRPNVGKSSLFNALIGSERAIVTDIAGTTRDAIEVPITCDGFPLRLIDTAGLHSTTDRVDRLGVEVSRRYLEGADVVLCCAESGRDLDPTEREFLAELQAPVVLVRTKADLVSTCDDEEGIRVSSMSGEGLKLLRSDLARLAFSSLLPRADLEPLVTRERHRAALRSALEEVEAFRSVRASGMESAVAAVHLRAAVRALEDIIGVVTTEDVLDRLFATFCVGK
ncbi:MAG: tRNA uridine-5-carboxymethylaminomethyl(34) synthesis GTPase MnmE [Gemmatimonadetes bacterium]|nr:tRNA uridine-5-carboxymethylaminomethyl(34) synthesis GTPase MnmE [Gemmatimonadota bacterium]